MKTLNINDINSNINYAILRNDRQTYLNKHYMLPFNMLCDLEIISGVSFELLNSLDYKLKCLINYIEVLLKDRDPKQTAFEMLFNFFEGSIIYTIDRGVIENIINTQNKGSYAFYPYNDFSQFIKGNDLKFSLKKDDISLLVDEDNNVNKIIIKIYEMLKDTDYKYLDEFIIYSKNKINQTILKKEVKK